MDIKEYSGKSVCFYTEHDFLERARSQFDTSVTTVVYEITDIDKVTAKIKKHFGGARYRIENDCVTVEPVDTFEKTNYNFADLVEIVYRLRDPDGCPWDRAQTNMSIRKNIIEEAYELVEAIELDDNAKMTEESGDVMLQSVLSSAISADEKKYDINDIITGLCTKLITRHTHIFGKDKAHNAEEALAFWDKAKAKEKHYTSVEDKIDSIPTTFGALMYADKVQKYIKKTGFDFPDLQGAIDKLYEEIDEFLSADEEHREAEGGDILFSAVNVLRMADINAEVALNGTTNRFKKRFFYIVEQAKKQGKNVEELTLDEMEKLYKESKRYE